MNVIGFLKVALLALVLQGYAANVLAALNIQHWTTAEGSEVTLLKITHCR